MDLRSKANSFRSNVGHLEPLSVENQLVQQDADDSPMEIKDASVNAGANDSAAGATAGVACDNTGDAGASDDSVSQIAFLTAALQGMMAFKLEQQQLNAKLAKDNALLENALETHRLDLMQQMESHFAELKTLYSPSISLPIIQPLDGLPANTILHN